MIHIGELHGPGILSDKTFHLHDMPYSKGIHSKLGKNVKLNASLHGVDTEVHPETGEKKMSLHFKVHGVHGLGDSLAESPEHSSKEHDLESAMSDAKI